MKRRTLAAAALVAAPALLRWGKPAIKRLLGRRDGDREAIKDDMVDALPDSEQAGAAPAPDAFVDPGRRD